MTHVRGHYRRNGSYVRPHTRRTTPKTAGTTRVRAHYRSDGTYVRSHQRTVTTSQSTPTGDGDDASLLIAGLIILLILIAAGIIAS
ncbi:hypothetical protein GCM10010112_72920 [Actinoplanes lobatus]|uniref:Uncharacterized protein n=1 Tax=Actinoplanes lobatus TaxID=113568 RepID=A0A7W7HRD3_9ACTN|nr:hypothetical protein [Actinoplanes lobatus]MBB4755189.1 hypothetical protein [Actinoplanes lobatus]GGN88957.1 hypothetical protein GCM10010112_72920 [Actinoplanes lobatus]GIE43394.1 hypothetical protein Alo02nite_62920 [Actinoplanes lobatus]